MSSELDDLKTLPVGKYFEMLGQQNLDAAQLAGLHVVLDLLCRGENGIVDVHYYRMAGQSMNALTSLIEKQLLKKSKTGSIFLELGPVMRSLIRNANFVVSQE